MGEELENSSILEKLCEYPKMSEMTSALPVFFDAFREWFGMFFRLWVRTDEDLPPLFFTVIKCVICLIWIVGSPYFLCSIFLYRNRYNNESWRQWRESRNDTESLWKYGAGEFVLPACARAGKILKLSDLFRDVYVDGDGALVYVLDGLSSSEIERIRLDMRRSIFHANGSNPFTTPVSVKTCGNELRICKRTIVENVDDYLESLDDSFASNILKNLRS